MKRYLLIAVLLWVSPAVYGQGQGSYFSKKISAPTPLPNFEQMRSKLPQPIYDENPLWVETYWQAWEIAFRNFYQPTVANGFVSQYIDAAFNNCIFMWDTSFMTMFCNYAHPLVPGIASLDNFYIKQYPDGEICREISRADGRDCEFWVNKEQKPLHSSWGYNVPGKFEKTYVQYVGRSVPEPAPVHTLDNMNHPIMAWAEVESFKITGDLERLKMVYEPLRRQYHVLQKYIRQGNGLYMTDWASMDNSARNRHLAGGGTGIDISCEMVLFAKNLAQIARLTGCERDAEKYTAEATELSGKINELMWSEDQKFYYDLTVDGKSSGVKTVAAYWTLVSGVARQEQADILAGHLTNPGTFGTKNLVPTLAADEPGFSQQGDYWCGSVWAPTTTMVIDGLERYGYRDLATRVALNHVALVANVYRDSGTIWENYAPNSDSHGFHADGKPVAKDFVGWSGIAPIKLFIEYGIGLKADATMNSIEWTIGSDKAVGCKDFRFNSNVVTLLADFGNKPGEISVTSQKPFLLIVNYRGSEQKFKVEKGEQILHLTY